MTKHHASKKERRRRMKKTGQTYQQVLRETAASKVCPRPGSASPRDPVPLPEPLRRAIQSMTAEAVMNCQEVLRYCEPDRARDAQRMTLYRATDAADTMDSVALLMAAFSQRNSMPLKTLDSYLQAPYQQDRALGPLEEHRAQLAALLGEAAPAGEEEELTAGFLRLRHSESVDTARSDDMDVERVWTAVCLHGLRAALCDDIDALDSYLPSHVARLARQVAAVLGTFKPASC